MGIKESYLGEIIFDKNRILDCLIKVLPST